MTYTSKYANSAWFSRPSQESLDRVEAAFNATDLRSMCLDSPSTIEKKFEMDRIDLVSDNPRRPLPRGEDFYLFKDHGARVLAVAHLDSCEPVPTCEVIDTAAGPFVASTTLDDRLGAYVIAHLLPALGIQCDLLFTVGEESGNSTAEYFMPSMHHERSYDWVIEFDRGGTDVVLYQYEDDDTIALVEAAGATVNEGAFSDISYLEHLGIKAFNWGVGYRDYHGPRAHAWLADTFKMVAYFLSFYDTNHGTHLPHEPRDYDSWYSSLRNNKSVTLDPLSSVPDTDEYLIEGCSEPADEAERLDCEGAVSSENHLGIALCEFHKTWYE